MKNYDQQELAKFAAVAAHWWDTAGELRTLHQINPLRLQFITEKVDLRDKKVLDVGCGGGILSESMAAKGAIVTGIDLNKSVIDVAKLHLYESNLQVEYLQTAAESLALTHQEKFDVITCLEMLEHVPDPLSVIEACSTMLKPGGQIFFSTINRNPKAYLYAILGAEYILQLLPKNTHDFAKFIKPSELSRWLRLYHIDVKALKGIGYLPLKKTFYLTDDVSVNYLLYAVKPA